MPLGGLYVLRDLFQAHSAHLGAPGARGVEVLLKAELLEPVRQVFHLAASLRRSSKSFLAVQKKKKNMSEHDIDLINMIVKMSSNGSNWK